MPSFRPDTRPVDGPDNDSTGLLPEKPQTAPVSAERIHIRARVAAWAFAHVYATTSHLPHENRWIASAHMDVAAGYGRRGQIRYGTTQSEAEKKAVAAVLEAVARSLRVQAAAEAT